MPSDRVSFSKCSLYSEKDSRIFNLSCRSMYDKLLTIKVTPTSVQYWNEKIDHIDEYVWKQIFLIPRSATIESYTRSFQHKILHNALFLNKKLFTMKLVYSLLCSLCKNHDETPIYLFCDCQVTVNLWKMFQSWISPCITLPDLTVTNALLGFLPDGTTNRLTCNLINHILLIFKRCLFELRSASSTPSIFYIVQKIKTIMQVEFEIAQNNAKLSFHFKKWDPISAFTDT